MPTKPTNAVLSDSGPFPYLRYLAHRCVERPELILDGARAAASPHISYLDRARGTSKSVLILSSQRSGSTLVAEVLAAHRGQRLMFEPLRGEAVRASRMIHRGQFADATTRDGDLHQLLTRIFDGRLRNLWVDRENTCRLPRGRVIKDCLGTNLAPYIVGNFPEVPVIYLLRHPIATAFSVKSLDWPDDLESILGQSDLMEEHFGAQRPVIDEVASGDRRSIVGLVLRWCLENYLPLRLLQPGSAHVVFYEHLLRHPDNELERLASFLRLRSPAIWHDWQPDAARLHRPSGTAWRDAGSRPTHDDRMAEWQRSVDPETVQRCLEVLEAFGLDSLYGEETGPIMKAEAVLEVQ